MTIKPKTKTTWPNVEC